MKYLSFVFLVLILSGCKKEVKDDALLAKQELVMQCFISPHDEFINVRLEYASNYFNRAESKAANALMGQMQVSISDGQTTKNIPFNSASGVFSLPARQMPLAEGKRYSLQVHGSQGLYLEAQTTIPPAPANAHMELGDKYKRNQHDVFKVYLIMQKEQTEASYLRFTLSSAYVPKSQRPYGFEQLNTHMAAYSKHSASQVAQSFEVPAYYYPLKNSPYRDGRMLRAYFLNLSEEYYRFVSSAQTNSEQSDNPFAEGLRVYTNVKGGLGVFAAYNYTYIDK